MFQPLKRYHSDASSLIKLKIVEIALEIWQRSNNAMALLDIFTSEYLSKNHNRIKAPNIVNWIDYIKLTDIFVLEIFNRKLFYFHLNDHSWNCRVSAYRNPQKLLDEWSFLKTLILDVALLLCLAETLMPGWTTPIDVTFIIIIISTWF